MVKLLIGIGLGAMLMSDPQARRFTAQVLRGTAEYLDPKGSKAKSKGFEFQLPSLPPLPLPKN